MATLRKSAKTTEYGDFQTPLSFARRACELLARRGIEPAAIVEPTCGDGNFLVAALDCFPRTQTAFGLEISAAHVETARLTLQGRPDWGKVALQQGSFFETHWASLLGGLPDPLLVVGNPPWVTNTELGTLGSVNLPRKTNFKNHAGLDAMTGKSNFDISEWMLLRILEWLKDRTGTMAMLCKTAVARKVLLHAWMHRFPLQHAALHLIDADGVFGVSVDACLLVCDFAPGGRSCDSAVHRSVGDDALASTIGYRDGEVIADLGAYERWNRLRGQDKYRWRSGIKHDCAKVMELHKEGRHFRNGLHELVELEHEYVYPMFKGSEIASGRTGQAKRWMLVPQRRMGEETARIGERAPRAWDYLNSHAELLDRRASSIYRNRPRFCIFGVGDYSFAPWKVAICGLYKKLEFAVVGSFDEKPVVLDDTCYFLACDCEEEARYLAALLDSVPAREFLSSLVFWDAKRPVTVDVLERLDLVAVARELGSEETIQEYLARKLDAAALAAGDTPSQLALF